MTEVKAMKVRNNLMLIGIQATVDQQWSAVTGCRASAKFHTRCENTSRLSPLMFVLKTCRIDIQSHRNTLVHIREAKYTMLDTVY